MLSEKAAHDQHKQVLGTLRYRLSKIGNEDYSQFNLPQDPPAQPNAPNKDNRKSRAKFGRMTKKLSSFEGSYPSEATSFDSLENFLRLDLLKSADPRHVEYVGTIQE
jgi:hypothetical protein